MTAKRKPTKKMKKKTKSSKSLKTFGAALGVATLIGAVVVLFDHPEPQQKKKAERTDISTMPLVPQVLTVADTSSGRSSSDFIFQSRPVVKNHSMPENLKSQVEKAPSQAQSVEEFGSCFQIGADYTYLNLKPHGHASFSGSLGGLQGSYEYKPRNNVYAAIEFAWKEGSVTNSFGRRNLLYIDTQERLGYTWASKRWGATLFSGFGYRHTGQKMVASTGHALKFQYNEIYVPVGMVTHYSMLSWLSMGLQTTWMPQVYPTVSTSSLKGARLVLSDTLSNFSVEVPVKFTLTKSKRSYLVLSPFYEHWEDGHLTAKKISGIPLDLPGNNYNFLGVNLNFLYEF